MARVLSSVGSGILLLLVLGSADFACGSSAPPPSAVPAVVPPPARAPSPDEVLARKTPEEASTLEDTKACDRKIQPRQIALCYLESNAETSIEPLFALGRALAEKAAKYSFYWQDFTYAAENAGALAAKTRDARLYVGIADSNEAEQLFAVHAIRQMLAKLRWGQAKGKESDDAVRSERLARAHAACLSKLTAQSTMLVNAATDCLKEVHDSGDTAAMIDVGVANPSLEVQAHVLDVASIVAGPCPTASLKKLVPLLQTPLQPSWKAADVSLRGSACRILLRGGGAREPWAKKAAAIAAREVGNRIGPDAKESCEAVVKEAP
jgi:hypothetical protein